MGTPVPIAKREGSPAGPVTTRQMTPEEIEKYSMIKPQKRPRFIPPTGNEMGCYNDLNEIYEEDESMVSKKPSKEQLIEMCKGHNTAWDAAKVIADKLDVKPQTAYGWITTTKEISFEKKEAPTMKDGDEQLVITKTDERPFLDNSKSDSNDQPEQHEVASEIQTQRTERTPLELKPTMYKLGYLAIEIRRDEEDVLIGEYELDSVIGVDIRDLDALINALSGIQDLLHKEGLI